ncbi:MAG: UvrD-helicase domain-containing protein [Acidimicrobiales bacterium]
MTRRRWHPVSFAVLPPAELVSEKDSDAEQDHIIECTRTGPCIAMAGPGTGKTHVLVARLGRRHDMVPGLRALVLTFTIRAGCVLEHRLAGRAIEKGAVVVRRTQKELWVAFLRAHAAGNGSRSLKFAGQMRARTLLCKAVTDGGCFPSNLEWVVQQALGAIEEVRAIPEELADVVTPDVISRYQRAKAKAGLVDNGDVRRWVIEHVHEIVDGWASQGYTEVYLDEAQDSSPAEIALMAAAARRGLRVCCVLDLRQSLYEFRGARPRDLLRALGDTDGHTHVMAVNRRSAQQVVSTLNAFSGWAFENESAVAMSALRVGGEPFRAVVCEEKAVVHEALVAALRAVKGLTRDQAHYAPRSSEELRDSLGLPEVLATGESLGILTTTGKEADGVVRTLEEAGYAPVRLVRDMDDLAAHELLHGILDPLGESGGPARIYGVASPMCLLLRALQVQGPFRMDPDSRGHKALDALICELRRVGHGASKDPGELFSQLWSTARKRCTSWAGGQPPADGQRSRLRALAVQARDCLDEWESVLKDCALPCSHEDHLERLLWVASTYLLPPRADGSPHPAISSLRRRSVDRDGASHLIETWYERPDLGRAERITRGPAKEGPVIYVAVVNQVKGDEFDWVVICALSENRFPYRGKDSFGERCRSWVAISRAREGTSYLGVANNDLYWPARLDT